MSSMAQGERRRQDVCDRKAGKEADQGMEEKTYKTMGGSGALSIALGVVVLVVGVASGVLLVISGAKLLAGRSKILF